MAQNNIVLQARMCCNSCRWKVYKAITGYPGVEDININMEGQTVTLKGNVDAIKLFEKVKKKSGNKITKLLHYPPPKEPKDVTVVLRICMDCGACRKKATNIAWCYVGDVYSVKPKGCDKLTIKGKDLDPKKVCEKMKKMLRYQAQPMVHLADSPHRHTSLACARIFASDTTAVLHRRVYLPRVMAHLSCQLTH